MKYNDLIVVSNKKNHRVGRGIAAGQGKTAGRGTKGQKSRTGYSARPGFEGGQNPLMQRLPKLPGFRSIRIKADIIFTGNLDKLAPLVTNQTLYSAGLVESPFIRVKLVVKGEVTKKVTVKLQACSATARASVEKAGGTVEIVSQIKRTPKTTIK